MCTIDHRGRIHYCKKYKDAQRALKLAEHYAQVENANKDVLDRIWRDTGAWMSFHEETTAAANGIPRRIAET